MEPNQVETLFLPQLLFRGNSGTNTNKCGNSLDTRQWAGECVTKNEQEGGQSHSASFASNLLLHDITKQTFYDNIRCSMQLYIWYMIYIYIYMRICLIQISISYLLIAGVMQTSKLGCFISFYLFEKVYRLGGWQIIGACHKVTLVTSTAASLKGTSLN